MFTEAIVRAIPETFDAGITSANLGKPGCDKAREQHDRYIGALERCGLKVTMLGADERHPDSVCIEDTAIVTDRCAIVTNSGADSRRGEVLEVLEVEKELSGHYENVERILSSGTLDGGDVLQMGNHFCVGRTWRTNREAAEQLPRSCRDIIPAFLSWGCAGSCTSRRGYPTWEATNCSWPENWWRK
jgi:dimethylargininase